MRTGRGASAAINVLLFMVVLGAGLLALEYASRWLLPVARGTQFLAADGNPALLVDGAYRLFPNVTFRQVSPDFDIVGHTGPRAMRAPEPEGMPNIVFVGDSFTFENDYPVDLQRELDTHIGSCTQVVNSGYAGSTIDHQRVVFEEQAAELRPKLVVV